MLTETERYNLLWLANAMTVPVSYTDERYYYDGVRKDLFCTIKAKGNPYGIGILNRFGLQYSDEIASDLAVRLELIDDESSEIVEIPRLNVNDKVGIQLEFLSKLPGTYWHNELIAAVEQQKDDHKFVLDMVLIENDNSAPLMSYWDDYKLKMVLQCIAKYFSAITIEFNKDEV